MASTGSGLPKVILLGGAPFSGKSTVARLLSRRLDVDLLHTDDFGRALRAAGRGPQSDGLDPMAGENYQDYYLQREVDALMQEALAAHRALWPAIREVVLARADWGDAAIVEGWALLPEAVAGGLPATCGAVWLVVDDEEFEPRLRTRPTFYEGARDEAELIKRFAERSAAFNRYLQGQLSHHGLPSVRPRPGDPPEITAESVMAALRSAAGEA